MQACSSVLRSSSTNVIVRAQKYFVFEVFLAQCAASHPVQISMNHKNVVEGADFPFAVISTRHPHKR